MAPANQDNWGRHHRFWGEIHWLEERGDLGSVRVRVRVRVMVALSTTLILMLSVPV